MLRGSKHASGQATCIFTDRKIPKGETAVEIQISTVQVRQAGAEGVRQAAEVLGIPVLTAEEKLIIQCLAQGWAESDQMPLYGDLSYASVVAFLAKHSIKDPGIEGAVESNRRFIQRNLE
jgi:hypothetical protein